MSAPLILRESTASQVVHIGPFVDETDGDTAETGLTIANTDIKIMKHGATASANKNSGGATHIVSGVYHATFDATDSNTVGPNGMVVVEEAGALIWSTGLIVLPADQYDQIYGDVVPAAPTALPVLGTATLSQLVAWIAATAGGLHETRQTASLWSVYNAAASATLGTATVSDDATTFTREALS
jgi:hypothetical protein